jgi:hypothetical protein
MFAQSNTNDNGNNNNREMIMTKATNTAPRTTTATNYPQGGNGYQTKMVMPPPSQME